MTMTDTMADMMADTMTDTAADTTTVRRILLADDDPSIRQVLTYNLRAEGFEVEAVEHGGLVCEALLEQPPDLLILDLMMPERDGLEVLRDIRDDVRLAHIPVVLLTAKATDQEVWAGWQAGADYYITKPFDLDEILNFLRYLDVDVA